MKLIRAVLRHSFLIAIVVGAGVAYYYRDELLPRFYEKVAEYRGTTEEESEPGMTPAPEQAAEAEVVVMAADMAAAPEPPPPAGGPSTAGGAEVAAPLPSPMAWSATPRATPAIEQAPTPVARPPMNLSAYRPLEDEPEEEKLEVAPVTTVPAATPTPMSTPVPVPELRGEAAAASQATATAPAGRAETPAPGTLTPPEATLPEAQVTAQAESEPAPGTVASPSVTEPPVPPDTARRDKLRIDARSAFWRHDYQQAEKNYQALIQIDPSDPDAYGELGNVYFSQGNWKAAGGAFYEAALRLIESGQVGRARHLLTVIQGLDPERARELEQQLATAQGGAGN